MADAIAHRGPDGAGTFVEHGTPGVALAHRRLSIIDLEGGAQPLSNEDGTVQICFNGEIFNYVELTEQLRARGHRFKTKTDTEVLAHLYEDHGDDFVQHLNGQFAIALWDARRKRLLLTRDRPGILPLFYTEQRGEIVFGSEIKAILAALPTIPGLNVEALRAVMTLWSPLSPETLFDGIVEVEPGQMLIVDAAGLCRRTYWTWTLAPEEHGGDARADRARADELQALLDDATRLRLRADVPVGAFVSGGLDSSLIAALVSPRASAGFHTYSIRFADRDLDEGQFQRELVSRVGASHTEVCAQAQDIATRFPAVIRAAEVPLTRTGPVAMHALAEDVRATGGTVVLTGEGADEVFGGYDLFKEAKVRAFCARRPSSTWRPTLLSRLYPSFGFTRTQPAALLAAYFGGSHGDPQRLAFSHETRWAAGPVVEQLLSDEWRGRFSTETPADRALARYRRQLDGLPLFERAQLLEARTLLAGYILSSQSDRMLMAHGVEGRFPYLDHRVIEFANRLPARLKLRGLNEKWLLKQVAHGRVPAAIVQRAKQPYRGPDATAFFGPNRPAYVTELLAPPTVRAFGYFDPARVTRLVNKVSAAAASGQPVSHRDSLACLTVLSTQVWHALFQTTWGWL